MARNTIDPTELPGKPGLKELALQDPANVRQIVDMANEHATALDAINALVLTGTGSPASVVSAPVGTLYLHTDGGASTTLYVKESGGSGNTGWVAK